LPVLRFRRNLSVFYDICEQRMISRLLLKLLSNSERIAFNCSIHIVALIHQPCRHGDHANVKNNAVVI